MKIAVAKGDGTGPDSKEQQVDIARKCMRHAGI